VLLSEETLCEVLLSEEMLCEVLLSRDLFRLSSRTTPKRRTNTTIARNNAARRPSLRDKLSKV